MDGEGTPNGSENQLLGLILKGIDDLRADVQGLRQEIAAGDEKRVSLAEFGQYQKATDGRLDKLEASPMKVLAWLGFAFGFVSPILTLVLFLIIHK